MISQNRGRAARGKRDLSLNADIEFERRDALLALEALHSDQIPFAEALALTRTAQRAQRVQKKAIPRRFETRNNFVQRGVRIEPGEKRDPRRSASVFWQAHDESRRDFAENLARQETGGTKKPRKRYLAIPRQVKTSKGGKILKRDLPSRALKRKNVFIANTRTLDTKGIYERTGGGRLKPLRMLYFLTPRDAKIGERFLFIETTEREARAAYAKEFRKAFAKARRTSKP